MQQPPVAAAPAVDRLLDVAHDEYRLLFGLRHGVLQQREEVFPLAGRGVLELVDHEALEAVAHLFVDERRIVAPDELREQVFRFRKQQRVLLGTEPLHTGVEVRQQGEAAVVLAQQVARVPVADVAVVEVAEPLQQGTQLRHEPLGRRSLGAPPLGRCRPLAERVGRCLHLAAGHREEIPGETAALAREVGCGKPRALDRLHRLTGRPAQLLACRHRAGRGPGHQTPELLLCGRGRECRLVLLLEELAREREDAVADVPLASLVDALLHEFGEPALQRLVHGDLVDERVGAFGEHRCGFDLDVVIQVEPQLLDEGAQNALEKGVDRQYGEARVVVENLRADLGRPPADAPLVELQFAAQLREVGARGSRGEGVDLLQDARLHLLGGLVGKGHGQDVAVEMGLVDDVADVFVGQLVGLSRPGACIQNLRSHSSKFRFW